MAISWGTEVKNSTGNGMRVGYEFSQSPSTVGAGTSSVTVTCRVYVWTRRSVVDSTNTLSITGNFSWSGNVSINHGNNGGQTLVRTVTRTVSTSYTGTVGSSISVSLTGINAIPGTARVSGSHTTARRPISAPDMPSAASTTRSSDTRQVFSWTRANPTNVAKPYQQQEIQRWDNVSDSYRAIATVGSGSTSYTDSSTVANRRYRYRIRAKNSAGTSSWRYSSVYVSTTPLSPSQPNAQKSGGDIRVAWANRASVNLADGVEIWHATNGVWDASALVVLSGQPTSWVHSSPDPAVTHRYRLKAQAKRDAVSLYSGYSSASNVVQLLAPPSAPSNLSPSATALDALDESVFSWRHNAVDTTDQTAYELQYRGDGGEWVGTGKTSGGVTSRTYPPETFENGTSVEWRVRTWGDHANASPWSQIAVITYSSRPAVTILAPAPIEDETPVVNSTQVDVSWDYFDPEATTQTGVRLRLEDGDGTQVWSRTLNSAATDHLIPYTLADGASYTLTVSVRDGHGLWSYEAVQPFMVEYAKPPTPTIDANWDLDLGGVVIQIEHPEPEGDEVAAVSAELWRSANGDEWELVAAGLEPSTTAVDFIPALDALNYYRVISVSGLPSTVESAPLPVITDSKGWIFVNGGPDFSVICKIRDNGSTSHSPSRVKVLNRFAGRAYAVETVGDARERSISLSGRIGGGSSTAAEWAQLADMSGPMCYREPSIGSGEPSERRFVSFVGFSVSRQRIFQEVSMEFEQVEGV